MLVCNQSGTLADLLSWSYQEELLHSRKTAQNHTRESSLQVAPASLQRLPFERGARPVRSRPDTALGGMLEVK